MLNHFHDHNMDNVFVDYLGIVAEILRVEFYLHTDTPGSNSAYEEGETNSKAFFG